MTLSIRVFILVLLAVMLSAMGRGTGSAESPPLELISGPDQVPKLEPLAAVPAAAQDGELSGSEPAAAGRPTFEMFREAVEGRFAAGGSWDPIADDILGILQTRGSLVERFPDVLWPESAKGEGDSRSFGEGQRDADGNGSLLARRAMAAEKLLRAARILEELQAVEEPAVAISADRVTLIRQMRLEARRLLPE